MSEHKMTGGQELRACVYFINFQREDFNDRFSAEELLKIWRYACAHPRDVAEFADTWPEWRVQDALGREIKHKPLKCSCNTEDCAGFYIDPQTGAVWPCPKSAGNYANAEALAEYVSGFLADIYPRNENRAEGECPCPGYAVCFTIGGGPSVPAVEVEQCHDPHGDEERDSYDGDDAATQEAIKQLSTWLGYRVGKRVPEELRETWGTREAQP